MGTASNDGAKGESQPIRRDDRTARTHLVAYAEEDCEQPPWDMPSAKEPTGVKPSVRSCTKSVSKVSQPLKARPIFVGSLALFCPFV